MRDVSDRHLNSAEIVDRVFPGDDRPTAVPPHLASCAACQSRVARLREAWLRDRGATEGVVDALPEAFWEAQKASILRRVEGESAAARGEAAGVLPFPAAVRRGRLLRRPVLAFGSLAAALALVAVVSIQRFGASPAAAPGSGARATPVLMHSPSSDQADDELLNSIERVLREEPAFTSLVPDETT